MPSRRARPRGSGCRPGADESARFAEGSAEAIPLHPARGVGRGGLRVSVVHPVAGAAARRCIQGVGLRHQRRRSATASVCWAPGCGGSSPTGRPARPRPRSWRVFLIVGAVLLLVSLPARAAVAGSDPGPDGRRTGGVRLEAAGCRWWRRWSSSVWWPPPGASDGSSGGWHAGWAGGWAGGPRGPWAGCWPPCVTVGLVSGVLVDGILGRDRPDLRGAGHHAPATPRCSRPPRCGRVARVRWSPGTPWGIRAATSPGRARRRPRSAAFTGTTAPEPIRAYAGIASAGECRGAGPVGGRRPRTGRWVRPGVPAGRRHHRDRLGGPGRDDQLRVRDRR